MNYNIFVVERNGCRRRLSTTNATRWLTEITFAITTDKVKVFTVTWLKCLVVQTINTRYNKVQHYAPKGRHSDWFKPYLYSRTQRVELKISSTCNYSSTWNTVKCGVPMGSVLGPLMFSVYIDDVPCYIDNSYNVIMYSDDRCIVTANNCYEVFNRNFKEII